MYTRGVTTILFTLLLLWQPFPIIFINTPHYISITPYIIKCLGF